MISLLASSLPADGLLVNGLPTQSLTKSPIVLNLSLPVSDLPANYLPYQKGRFPSENTDLPANLTSLLADNLLANSLPAN